jgi:hypothetical protein
MSRSGAATLVSFPGVPYTSNSKHSRHLRIFYLPGRP